ncbi:hypothetical protein WME73_48105 [Sorangium sp. So ce302]|uniref:hypothetical protein n=1 Tax=Sorangium sp. So ce302 TaxID=3133297 RepID=UPI003F61802C
MPHYLAGSPEPGTSASPRAGAPWASWFRYFAGSDQVDAGDQPDELVSVGHDRHELVTRKTNITVGLAALGFMFIIVPVIILVTKLLG